jgi:tyrosyl-tRNA synthetase
MHFKKRDTMLNFIEELNWRGMLHDMTPGVAEELEKGNIKAYIGFDPTADSLTIGNMVQIMMLKLWQLSGHTPIVVMGGATGRIGDPSGKDKERQLKSIEDLNKSLAFQEKQFLKFLDFETNNKAVLINNFDFYKDLNVLDFLRNAGKTLTINYMLSKDSVKNRIETGMSFTEFSYQLLQAYDFQCLYESIDVKVQIGGSDQWGNITSGTEFIKRNLGGKAYAITTPLLTKADGTKFGKSEAGNIWLDPNMTSPYQFYQFWLNIDDADLSKFTRYFTLKSRAEIEAREQEFVDNPRHLKKLLAEELTERVHSKSDLEIVQQVTELLFANSITKDTLLELDEMSFEIICNEIPKKSVPIINVGDSINIIDFLSESTTIFSSKGEARRALQGNSISINREKIISMDIKITSSDLIHGKYIMVENGKKNKIIIVAE